MRTCLLKSSRRPSCLGLFQDDVAAADQDGVGQAFIHHRLHRAQHAVFLAFGIDHACGDLARATSNTGRISWPER